VRTSTFCLSGNCCAIVTTASTAKDAAAASLVRMRSILRSHAGSQPRRAIAASFVILSSPSVFHPGDEAPRYAKLVAVVSLSMWIGVIVCGRLLTFYRPGGGPDSGPGLIADCYPQQRAILE
jgi:hypothetical protein